MPITEQAATGSITRNRLLRKRVQPWATLSGAPWTNLTKPLLLFRPPVDASPLVNELDPSIARTACAELGWAIAARASTTRTALLSAPSPHSSPVRETSLPRNHRFHSSKPEVKDDKGKTTTPAKPLTVRREETLLNREFPLDTIKEYPPGSTHHTSNHLEQYRALATVAQAASRMDPRSRRAARATGKCAKRRDGRAAICERG
jgi:hypothetical protein